jgi:hypothetical protein
MWLYEKEAGLMMSVIGCECTDLYCMKTKSKQHLMADPDVKPRCFLPTGKIVVA